MANDPYVPLDLKPRISARIGGLPRRGAYAGASEAGVETTAPVPPTPEAVNAGPPRPVDVVDASGGARPPSTLDANQPLPSGVRLYGGTPGTNDVIYEGRGRFGERAFGNNQFNVDGRVRGTNPALDAQADLRAREISGYVDAQRAAAGAAAAAAATTPMTAKDLTDRMKAVSDIKAQDAETGIKRATGALDVQAKANANVTNDYFTGVSNTARDEALKAGAPPEIAQERGQAAAINQAVAAGLDPNDPSLPPAARAGMTSVKRGVARLLNEGYPTNWFLPSLNSGKVVNPDDVNLSDFELSGKGPLGGYTLTGPADQFGHRREVRVTDADLGAYAPILRAARSRGVKRRVSAKSD